MLRQFHILGLLGAALLAGCATLPEPALRTPTPDKVSTRLTVLAYHDVREDIKRNFAPDQYAVSAENLAMQFAWLRNNGYKVVSLDQVLAAQDGRRQLPLKPVLLVFDDGLQSTYTAVFPLLQLFDYPAVFSIVTSWIESDVEVAYENHLLSSRDFLTWAQLREMQDSGLVEIVSHTHDLHHGVQGNPQGNEQPAGVTRIYANGSYENYADYLARIELDLATSQRLLTEKTGRPARAVVWPYGRYNDDLRNLAALHGMALSFSLDSTDQLAGFPVLGRELMISNPGVDRFAAELMELESAPILRAAQVDLDYVYDPNPVVQEANLSVLLDRIKALGISHVFLQAFSDPDGDGAADALYFPNRRMPMRADLFNRVTWQLRTRSGVKVFAWMPLLAFTGPATRPEWQLLQLVDGDAAADDAGEPRLSVFVPEARQFIRDVYADLGTYAPIDGIHFHDDGRMNEFEDANPVAIQAYRAALGPDFDISQAPADEDLLLRWSEFKAKALTDFSLELAALVATKRPSLQISRNVFASAVLDKRGITYLAQDFDSCLANYDYVTIMAMPLLEDVANEQRFYEQLVAAVAERPGAFQRTVFQLQTVDWRQGNEPLSSVALRDEMRSLQGQGVRNLAYYPDDFLQNHPDVNDLMQGISLADQPVQP